MRATYILLILALGWGGMVQMVLPVAASDPNLDDEVKTASPTDKSSVGTIDEAVNDIAQAETPSNALFAYATGLKIDPDSPELNDAYLKKMVDFKLPHVAYDAAQKLIAAQPQNGLAWSVLAYTEAQRGNMPVALANIVLAAENTPDNPFVQQTTGQLFAWYDNYTDLPDLPDAIKTSLVNLKKSFALSPAYTDAYQQAAQIYQKEDTENQQESAEQNDNNTIPEPPYIDDQALEPFDWSLPPEPYANGDNETSPSTTHNYYTYHDYYGYPDYYYGPDTVWLPDYISYWPEPFCPGYFRSYILYSWPQRFFHGSFSIVLGFGSHYPLFWHHYYRRDGFYHRHPFIFDRPSRHNYPGDRDRIGRHNESFTHQRTRDRQSLSRLDRFDHLDGNVRSHDRNVLRSRERLDNRPPRTSTRRSPDSDAPHNLKRPSDSTRSRRNTGTDRGSQRSSSRLEQSSQLDNHSRTFGSSLWNKARSDRGSRNNFAVSSRQPRFENSRIRLDSNISRSSMKAARPTFGGSISRSSGIGHSRSSSHRGR